LSHVYMSLDTATQERVREGIQEQLIDFDDIVDLTPAEFALLGLSKV